MSDLRLLVVCETLGRGGAEQALVNLLPSLPANGCRCEVAALHEPYTLAPELERHGITVHRLDMTHRWFLPQGIARLARLLRRGGYDVVHGHLFFSGLYLSLTRLLAPQPVRVVTFHNLGYDSFPAKTLWRKVRKAMDGWLMRRCIDAHVAVSGAVAAHYGQHLRLPSVTVIPNAFPVAHLQRVDSPGAVPVREGLGLSPDDFVLLLCGRLIPEKGHRFFLDAMALLKRRGLRLQALIAGDGPLRDDTAQRIREHGLDDCVRMVGAVSLDHLIGIMRAADLLVMPSTHEGFPLTPGEAMAVGLPVLASRVGGIPELVEDGVSGQLLLPGYPTVLANAIARLMADDETRRRYARAGQLRVEQHFSAGQLAIAWMRYYRQLCAMEPVNDTPALRAS